MRLIDADQMAVDEYEAYMSAQVQITDDLKWLVNFAAHSKIQRLIAIRPPLTLCWWCGVRTASTHASYTGDWCANTGHVQVASSARTSFAQTANGRKVRNVNLHLP